MGSGQALQMAAQGSRKTRASLHLRVPHRHEQRGGKGGQLRRFPHHSPPARAGAGLRHPPDHGPSGASLLRFLRLPGEQFLRPEFPFRHPRRIQGAGGRRPWPRHSGDNGHRAFPCREQRTRRSGQTRRPRRPLLLSRSGRSSSGLGFALLRLRKGRGELLPALELQILDGRVSSGRLPFRRSHLHALLGPRPGYRFRQLRDLFRARSGRECGNLSWPGQQAHPSAQSGRHHHSGRRVRHARPCRTLRKGRSGLRLPHGDGYSRPLDKVDKGAQRRELEPRRNLVRTHQQAGR